MIVNRLRLQLATGQMPFPERTDYVVVVTVLQGKRPRKPSRFEIPGITLAVWKLAIICEGLYAGYLGGTAANQRAAEMEWRVPRLIERTQRIMAGEL